MVLTTYDTLRAEWVSGDNRGLFQSSLWCRVVLDEGKQAAVMSPQQKASLIHPDTTQLIELGKRQPRSTKLHARYKQRIDGA